uniref:DOG1 domain-containing protein n=1 Tax=Ananas comosus var. bracteatus TaxID=296719 RepID=A0A6V7P3E7_ANACO|nr:unnamed protein product [Ananas comosus var. bracteatus]
MYAETLNIFPSQPMHEDPSPNGGVSLLSPTSSGSKRSSEQSMEPTATQEMTTQQLCLRLGRMLRHQRSPAQRAHQFQNVDQDTRSQEAAMFNMEYARWQEEHDRLMCELRAAVQEQLPENELRLFVENSIMHYDEMIDLKSIVVKSDVFHLISGAWKTPAERCFMWMGDFRPPSSSSRIDPLTEQQILGVCGLQQSTQETEEALSQGLEALQQSLSDTIASDALISCPSNMANYMGQMAIAMNKLATLEGFVRQAENLRHQTLHRLHHLLTTRQMARCLLAIAEYFHRLRALSSLWLSRPRQD